MGQEGVVTDAELLPAQQKSDWKFQENRLSVRQSEELIEFTSAVVEGLVERNSAIAEAHPTEQLEEIQKENLFKCPHRNN